MLDVAVKSYVKVKSIATVRQSFELKFSMNLKDGNAGQMQEDQDSTIEQQRATKRLTLLGKPCLKPSHTDQQRKSPKTGFPSIIHMMEDDGRQTAIVAEREC